MQKSKGHIGFVDNYEYYAAEGNVYRAHVDNIFPVNSPYRMGRWECEIPHYRHFWGTVYNRYGLPNIDESGAPVQFELVG